jgi:hypothetical protein
MTNVYILSKFAQKSDNKFNKYAFFHIYIVLGMIKINFLFSS